MKGKIIHILFLFILLAPSAGECKNVTIEDVYRELKIFEAKVDERFNAVDERFNAVDERFNAVDNRFNDLFTFLWIITGIFTAMTISVIGFAYWDRRTVIIKAKSETIKEIETIGMPARLLKALQELAGTDKKLASVLRQFNLF